MQIGVSTGGTDMAIGMVPRPKTGIQDASGSENKNLEVQQSEKNISFINIFIKGKSQVKELITGQEEKNIFSSADDSDNNEEVSLELLSDGQVVQLFAVAGISTDKSQSENAYDVPLAAMPPSESPAIVATYMRSQESDQELDKCADQVEATSFESEAPGKIIEALRSMSGGDTSEDNLGETSNKGKNLLSADITNDLSPAHGMTFGETVEQPDYSEIKSYAVEKALDRFIGDLSGVSKGKSEIRIDLEPETLGALTISVSRGTNGVSAKIISGDRETCAIITDQIQRLIQSMENKGIKVENVDVIFGQMQQEMNFAQNYHGDGKEFTSQNSFFQNKEKTEQSDRAVFFEAWNGYNGSTGAVNGATEYRI